MITLCFAFGYKNYRRGLPFYFKLFVSSKELSKCLMTIFERCICGEIHISKEQYCALDQALEKRTCKKSLRNNWICLKKEAICKQNAIRHQKATYKKFLSEPCLLNEGDECTHHEFFKNVDGKV